MFRCCPDASRVTSVAAPRTRSRAGDLDQRAGRTARAEVLHAHRVDLFPVGHVPEEDGHLADIGEGRAGGGETLLEVLVHLAGLGHHVAAADRPPVLVARHAAGHEHESVSADHVGEMADGLRHSRHPDLFAMRWHPPLAFRQMSAAIVWPTSMVEALPPRSRVSTLPSSTTRSTADTTARAASVWPRCSSIMAPVQIWAMGLAMPLPAMSGAEPCTGSNMDGYSFSGLMLPPGAIPMEPAMAGPRSERMSPKRLLATTTSNQSGCWTKWAVRMSMWNWSVLTAGYSFAMAAKRSSQ